MHYSIFWFINYFSDTIKHKDISSTIKNAHMLQSGFEPVRSNTFKIQYPSL